MTEFGGNVYYFNHTEWYALSDSTLYFVYDFIITILAFKF